LLEKADADVKLLDKPKERQGFYARPRQIVLRVLDQLPVEAAIEDHAHGLEVMHHAIPRGVQAPPQVFWKREPRGMLGSLAHRPCLHPLAPLELIHRAYAVERVAQEHCGDDLGTVQLRQGEHRLMAGNRQQLGGSGCTGASSSGLMNAAAWSLSWLIQRLPKVFSSMESNVDPAFLNMW
jgi:hypothetical protein